MHAYISFIMDEVGLVFVSADKEAFEELRGWKESVVEVGWITTRIDIG